MPRRRKRLIEVFGEPGTVLRIDGQEFVLAGRAAVRPDAIEMVHWTSHCWECGVSFEQFCMPGVIPAVRRCRDHAKPYRVSGTPAKPVWLQT